MRTQKSGFLEANDVLLTEIQSNTVLQKLDSMIGLLSSSSSTFSPASSSSPSSSSTSSNVVSSSVLRVSLADTIGNQAREEEIINLRKELAECRDDLERDEEIFAEKVRDLKNCRRELRSTRQDNIDLQDKILDYTSKIARNNAENCNNRQEFIEGGAVTMNVRDKGIGGERFRGRGRGSEIENVMEMEYKVEHKSDSNFYNDDNSSNNIKNGTKYQNCHGHNNDGNESKNSDSNSDMKSSGNGRGEEQDDPIEWTASGIGIP